ncbi:hypothetical protein D1P53_005607 [Cryptococcus gattii VGV]|nr:hypothetical protein D1P53_005607 [Cryptococcus gattii VGV]
MVPPDAHAQNGKMDFWGEAAKYIAFSHNCSFDSNNQIPFERWYGKKLLFTQLCAFGEKIFFRDYTNTNKLKPCCRQGRFMGYANQGVKDTILPKKQDIVQSKMSARGSIQVLEEWDNKDNKSKSVYTQDPLAEIPDKIIPAPMEVNPQDEAQPDEAPAPEHQSPMELLCRLARHDKETNSDVSSIDPLALTDNPETWGSITQALNAMASDTPNSYREAIQSGEGEQWHQAMMEELEKMEKYKVSKVVDRAPGQRVLKAR